MRTLITKWLTLAACLMAPVWAVAQDYGDTPYVQTPQVVVDKMLEMAKVSAKDFLIDLGSGDGRLIITAAKKYGARGFGVNLNKSLVTLANRNAAKAGVANRAVFYEQDLHDTDITKADVLTIYLLPEVNLMVRSRILDLKPGTRLVSHDYGFGEWQPDVEIEGRRRWLGNAQSDGNTITFFGTGEGFSTGMGNRPRGGLWMATSTESSSITKTTSGLPDGAATAPARIRF